MNPYLIIGLIVAWLASLTGVGYWQHGAGEDEQKVADQAQFDGINKKLADQKTEAAAILAKRNAENLTLMAERDAFKNTLEQERIDHAKVTDDLRTKYAGRGLRFKPQQDGRSGGCSGSPQSTTGNAPSNEAASALQLPDSVTANLRRLTFDADDLNDDYRLCYNYTHKVK